MYNTPYPTQPAVQTQAPPPPYPPAGPAGPKGSWPRLALLVGAVIVLASFLPATLSKSAASARKAAYPQPAISISSGGNTSFRTGQSITFTVNVSAGKDLTFDWNVNGQTFTGPSVTTSFDQPGQQTAHVTATDPIGQSVDAQMSVNVLPPAPVACFTASPDSYSTYYYYVDASCSTGDIQNYIWDFGDGVTQNSYGSSYYHDYYPSKGTFTITLRVTDNYGQSDTTSQTVTVTG